MTLEHQKLEKQKTVLASKRNGIVPGDFFRKPSLPHIRAFALLHRSFSSSVVCLTD